MSSAGGWLPNILVTAARIGARILRAKRVSWLIPLALLWGLWQTIGMLVLWWYGVRNDWVTTVSFNTRNEAVLEGVLMHIGLGVIVVATVVALKKGIGR